MTSDEIRDTVQKLAQKGLKNKEIAEKAGLGITTVKKYKKMIDLHGPSVEREDVKEMKRASLREQLRRLEAGEDVLCESDWEDRRDMTAVWSAAEVDNERRIEKAKKQGLFRATLPAEPVALSFISDQHISAGNTVDLKRMREDAELIAQTPGVYAIMGGDGVDNHCLDQETELLTLRGWLRFSEIRPNDCAFGMDPADGRWKWQKIEKVVVGLRGGDMIAASSDSVNMLITPGHRVMHYQREPGGVNDSRVSFTIASESTGTRKAIPIGAMPHDSPDWPGASDNEISLVAWILTDGWECKSRGKVCTYSIGQRGSNAGKIRELIQSLDMKFSESTKSSEDVLASTNLSVKSAECLTTFRISAHSIQKIKALLPNKSRLPSWVYKLSRRQFLVFLDAIIDGDGSQNGNNSAILYGKESFLEQVQVLCVINGVSAKIRRVSGRQERRLLINKKHYELVKFDESPVLYCGFVWCLNVPYENFMARRDGKPFATGNCKIHAAVLAARSKPSDQYELFSHYLSILRHKILVVISGNHDAYTVQVAGVDVLGRIAAEHKICYAPAEARIECSVGQIKYKVAVRHQYRMNSSYNLGHSVKQWWRMGDGDFDIGCVCHHHEPHIESFQAHGAEKWACRPGSYQITSSYSRQYGFNNATPTCPTFVVYPDRKEIIGFRDIRPALRLLKAERGA